MPYTCRLTVVNDGMSDSVIKIYPAEMPEAKVWMNRVSHKEWWEMVQQNMARYAERGTRIEKPIPYHADPRNLSMVTLKEENIPLVRLDGWVVPNLPPEEKMPNWSNAQGSMLEHDKRLRNLEGAVNSIGESLERLANKLDKLDNLREPTTPSNRVMTEAVSEAPELSCCGKSYKPAGYAAHRRIKHTEG